MNLLHTNLDALQETISIIKSSDTLTESINCGGDIICDAIRQGKKILIAGNGGSAAEAQHFSAELIARFKKERASYPSIALTTDTSILTAIGNDYGFDEIFKRQIAGLGNEGDVFVVMSTSGNSPNIIEAVKLAKEKNIHTIGLLGKDGGRLKDMVDTVIIVPSPDTARIQEMHLLIIHTWCESVDTIL
jgi:D-sedoheptulose 7-phosphate isomerase